jgi:hypothetical protein
MYPTVLNNYMNALEEVQTKGNGVYSKKGSYPNKGFTMKLHKGNLVGDFNSMFNFDKLSV